MQQAPWTNMALSLNLGIWTDPGPDQSASALDGTRPEAIRLGPGSVQIRGGPLWAWISPGRRKIDLGLDGPRPKMLRLGPRRIQAWSGPLWAWIKPRLQVVRFGPGRAQA